MGKESTELMELVFRLQGRLVLNQGTVSMNIMLPSSDKVYGRESDREHCFKLSIQGERPEKLTSEPRLE